MPQKQSETIIPPLTAARCPFYCLVEMIAMMMVCYYIIQIFSTNNEEATLLISLRCLGRKDFTIKSYTSKYNLKTNYLKWLVCLKKKILFSSRAN